MALVRYPLGQDDALVFQAANVGSIVARTVLRHLAYRHWVLPAAAALPVDGPDGRTAPARLR